MTTNKPAVVGYINELCLNRLRYDDYCGYVQIYARQLPEHSELPKRLPLICLSDYQKLHSEYDQLRKDAERIDWLADPENSTGGVLLPTGIVTQNIHSLRDAIDAAMQETGHDNQ